jgi:hypothetical protein
MGDTPADDQWEQNIVPIRIHINAWAAAAIIVGLLQFKAVAVNPPEFYNTLRWLTLPVSIFGLYVALEHYFFGWTFLFAAIAVLFNPMTPFQLSRPTWFWVDLTSGGILIASALLLRWNTENRWITRPRDIIDKSVEVAVLTIVSGMVLHLAVVIGLLPIGYLLSGDERLADNWTHWRNANLWLVGVGTVAVVWLYYWITSPAAIRRFLTEPRPRR